MLTCISSRPSVTDSSRAYDLMGFLAYNVDLGLFLNLTLMVLLRTNNLTVSRNINFDHSPLYEVFSLHECCRKRLISGIFPKLSNNFSPFFVIILCCYCIPKSSLLKGENTCE